MTVSRLVAYMVLVGCLSACTDRKGGDSRADANREAAVTEKKRAMALPKIPEALTEPEARMHYLLTNYWSALDWASQEVRTDTAMLEQGMVNFLELLQYTDSTTVTDSYRAFLRSVPPEGRPTAENLIRMSGDYLFTPDSPVYNPQVYACTIDALFAEGLANDEVTVERLRHQHAEIMKNRPGSRAADFAILTLDGRLSSLSKIAGEYARSVPSHSGGRGTATIILFFYDPDCEACAAVEARLAADPKLDADIESGKVLFLAVDPYGTDSDKWRNHASSLPKNWLIGYSPRGEVDDRGLYMLKASPTVYILAPDLTVLSQDARF